MIAHGRGTMRALSSLIGILVSLELWVPAMAQSPLSAGRERALKPGDTFKECDACPEMVVVPAGSFAMGSPNNEKARDNNEGPQHQVTITRSFAFGKFEVTVDQFVAFVQETGHDTGSTCDIWQDGKWAERSGYSWRKASRLNSVHGHKGTDRPHCDPHRSAGTKIRPCRGCLAQSGETAEEALERHYLTCPADRWTNVHP